MSEQPEPDSGYACDRAGTPWYHSGSRWFIRPGGEGRGWTDLAETYGPMTPLLPAVRPDGVPDDAVPFVGWANFSPASDGQVCTIWSPNGAHIAGVDSESADEMGYPVPAAPAPSLPERLRELAFDVLDGLPMTNHAGYVKQQESTAALIREAADALEAGSQP